MSDLLKNPEVICRYAVKSNFIGRILRARLNRPMTRANVKEINEFTEEILRFEEWKEDESPYESPYENVYRIEPFKFFWFLFAFIIAMVYAILDKVMFCNLFVQCYQGRE